MTIYFDHEKLIVYQESISFVAWAEDIIQRCEGKASAKRHLDEASASIPHNIAEGNGKWLPKDRRRYFEIARGSALECAASLDVLVAKGRLGADEVIEGKEMLKGVVSMLTRMVINLSDQACEEEPPYGQVDDGFEAE